MALIFDNSSPMIFAIRYLQ